MNGHTPGPWEAVAPSPSRNTVEVFADFGGAPHCVVARAYGWRLSGEVSIEQRNALALANARLIAAAPEMYDVLRDLREACTAAYQAGRIPAEPFVRAGNVLAQIEVAR